MPPSEVATTLFVLSSELPPMVLLQSSSALKTVLESAVLSLSQLRIENKKKDIA